MAAARQLVDHVCGRLEIPLLIAHDFDIHGFRIAARLTTESQDQVERGTCKYFFKHSIEATDIGLRLSDIEKYELSEETHDQKVQIDSYTRRDLGLLEQEVEFLESGRRVELNAFTSPQFVEWLESKLRENGISENWHPTDEDVLRDHYQRAWIIGQVQKQVNKIIDNFKDEIDIPKDIVEFVKEAMEDSTLPWDEAVAEAISEELDDKD